MNFKLEDVYVHTKHPPMPTDVNINDNRSDATADKAKMNYQHHPCRRNPVKRARAVVPRPLFYDIEILNANLAYVIPYSGDKSLEVYANMWKLRLFQVPFWH